MRHRQHARQATSHTAGPRLELVDNRLPQQGPPVQDVHGDRLDGGKSCKEGARDDELRQWTLDKTSQMRGSEEGQEGLSSFLERRKPNWSPK